MITTKVTLAKAARKRKASSQYQKADENHTKDAFPPILVKLHFTFHKKKIPLKAMMKSVYLNTMPMSSISPAGRRQCHQIMRKVNKYINQIPMPNCIRIRVRPTLHKFIISIPLA